VCLGFVARGEHDPAANDHRPPAQTTIVALLNRGEERVGVGVENRCRPSHEPVFAQMDLP
jgi:hypothetical protein